MANPELERQRQIEEANKLVPQEIDLFNRKMERYGDILWLKYTIIVKSEENTDMYKIIDWVKYKQVD